MNPSPQPVPEAPRKPGRRLAAELMVAALLLLASGVWATQFWNTWTAQGGQPAFYQIYFEPAVMIACGKGFVISQHQPKVLEDFLWQRRDRLACEELPADMVLGDQGLYQEAWTYLQYTVGWAWRLLGISWSGMGPLFGLLFGVVTALAYGIFRLGMGRAMAIVCTTGMATSSMHLLNLPHLRDYSKAPFTLGLVLILGLLVARPFRRRTVLLLAAAYGVVLGLGYGFRTDLLINLPVLAVVLFGFLEGSVTKNLVLKVSALALFLVTFVAVSWPITSAVYQKGGCQWHVALLGLQSPFEDRLRLTPAPYDFGYEYADGYVIRGVQGFARRTNPQGPVPGYCSHEYDVQSGRLLFAIITTFPGDFVTRAYASMLQIVELPFVKLGAPAGDWAAPMFTSREAVLKPRHSWGALLAGLAMVLATTASFRLGLFLLFFLAYFGGYPAVQFQERHFFHLEFIGWWSLGFCLHQAVARLAKAFNGREPLALPSRPLITRFVVFGVITVAALGGLLGAARWYQVGQARQLFATYLSAPKAALADPYSPLPDVGPRDWPQFLEVQLNETACGPWPAVTFRYDRSNPDSDFTRTITIARRTTQEGTTRVLLPVYERFAGLELSDPRPGCFVGASRVTELASLPLLLGVTLPPDWATRPLYQRVARWEGDAEPLAHNARFEDTGLADARRAPANHP